MTRRLHVGTAISKYNKAIILSQRCQEDFLINKNNIYYQKILSLKSLFFVWFFYSGGDVAIVSYHKPPLGVPVINHL